MSFLAPWFLLGVLAIGGPILFHLIRRSTRKRFTFSSLMFLRPEPPRVTRKSRLEDILLLLARCLPREHHSNRGHAHNYLCLEDVMPFPSLLPYG